MFGKRDELGGEPGGERERHGGEVDQGLALGVAVAGGACLAQAAGSGWQ